MLKLTFAKDVTVFSLHIPQVRDEIKTTMNASKTTAKYVALKECKSDICEIR